MGIARDQWLDMHNYWSLAFAALLILHLLLHGMYFRNIRKCLKQGSKETDDCLT